MPLAPKDTDSKYEPIGSSDAAGAVIGFLSCNASMGKSNKTCDSTSLISCHPSSAGRPANHAAEDARSHSVPADLVRVMLQHRKPNHDTHMSIDLDQGGLSSYYSKITRCDS